MATLVRQGKRFYCYFAYKGKRHSFPLGKVKPDEAESKARMVDYLLMRLGQGLLQIPVGQDIISFLQCDGKPPERPEDTPLRRGEVTLDTLRKEYLKVHQGSLEDTTIVSMTIHLKHLVATLGDGFPISRLTLADLQRHADRRRTLKFRGQRIGPTTIRKELVSLRTVWNWGVPMGLVSGPFPQLKRVTLAKFEERPPFQTRAEIERQIALGGWTERQIEELWHCLYLRPAEMQALLAHVEKHARPPWLHPLVATAAYTGMRRSELARAEVGDVDLHGNSLIVRERKRRRSEKTTRRVALHPVLRTILQGWLRSHPGGRFLFSHPGVVARSKKRSKLTGYRGKSRATTGQGRLATLRERGTSAVTGLTPNEVHDHFRRTLRDSAWDVLPGLHCLRHSFVSCLASAGCDQRIIDEFVGHQTDQQRRRYRHIFPERKDDALRAAFG